jgi:hypothetical protein
MFFQHMIFWRSENVVYHPHGHIDGDDAMLMPRMVDQQGLELQGVLAQITTFGLTSRTRLNFKR